MASIDAETLQTTVTAASRDAAIEKAVERATAWFGTDKVDVEITHVSTEETRYGPNHTSIAYVVDFACRDLR